MSFVCTGCSDSCGASLGPVTQPLPQLPLPQLWAQPPPPVARAPPPAAAAAPPPAAERPPLAPGRGGPPPDVRPVPERPHSARAYGGGGSAVSSPGPDAGSAGPPRAAADGRRGPGSEHGSGVPCCGAFGGCPGGVGGDGGGRSGGAAPRGDELAARPARSRVAVGEGGPRASRTEWAVIQARARALETACPPRSRCCLGPLAIDACSHTQAVRAPGMHDCEDCMRSPTASSLRLPACHLTGRDACSPGSLTAHIALCHRAEASIEHKGGRRRRLIHRDLCGRGRQRRRRQRRHAQDVVAAARAVCCRALAHDRRLRHAHEPAVAGRARGGRPLPSRGWVWDCPRERPRGSSSRVRAPRDALMRSGAGL